MVPGRPKALNASARWRPVRVAWLLVAIAASGCLGGGGDPLAKDPEPEAGRLCLTPTTSAAEPGEPAPVAAPLREGFESPSALAGALPYLPHATDGAWIVKTDPDAPEGENLVHGFGDTDPGFSAFLFPRAGDLGDLDLRVSFNIACVEHPHGVGVVLHVQDADDYQIVRYSASESAWDFFTVRGGERTRHESAHVGSGTDPQPGTWVDLRVTSVAGRVEAYDGSTLVLSFDLEAEDAASGQVGLFLRGSSDARFDDVAVGPPRLPA